MGRLGDDQNRWEKKKVGSSRGKRKIFVCVHTQVWTDAGCVGDEVAPVTGLRAEVVLPPRRRGGMLFLGFPSCPRFPQAPRFAGGPSETGLRPSELQDFLPMAGWAAKWCGDVEG